MPISTCDIHDGVVIAWDEAVKRCPLCAVDEDQIPGTKQAHSGAAQGYVAKVSLNELTDLICDSIDHAIRKSECACFDEWQGVIYSLLKENRAI